MSDNIIPFKKPVDVKTRMGELMSPIDKQIQRCNSREDMLMLSCAMLQRVREMFDATLGEEGRKTMFKDLV